VHIDHVWDLRLLDIRRHCPAHHEIGHVDESIVLHHRHFTGSAYAPGWAEGLTHSSTAW
jgi:hypothetical protein